MTTRDHSTDDARREIEDLLPWYVAGTLSAAEADRVEAALSADPTLQPLLEMTREEMSETVLMNQALGAPTPRALDALFAKIDAEPARRSRSLGLFDLGGRLAAWLQPKTLGWTGVAAAAIIAVQAGILLQSTRQEAATGYRTASSGEPAAAQTGTFLLLSFAPQATAADIAATLQSVDAVIVDGPRAGGIFRVRIGPLDLPRAEADRIVGELRGKATIVRFVGFAP